LVAFPEAANALRVSLDGVVLLEQTATGNELEVDAQWPASLSGTESVRWRASTDGCAASLGYSNDGGRTWMPLALPGPADTIAVDARSLPGGQECLLELVVTDGFQTLRHRSDTYEVEPKGWTLRILSPADGARVVAGQPVVLAAQAYHLEERRATFDDIQWTSNAGGGLATGGQAHAVLEPGEHAITASAYGAAAEVTVTVA
jgi:hypothetical protein